MQFSRNKRDFSHKNFLVIDIGSASVGAALIDDTRDERPEILLSHRIDIPPYDEVSYERMSALAMSTLEKVVSFMLHHGTVTPHRIFVILRAPWTTAQMRTLHMHQKTPFVFTKKLADDMIQGEIDRYHQKQIKDFAEYADDHNLLEHKTMRVKLNGYTIHEPLGKKAQRIEMSSFMSVIPRDIEQRIHARIERAFHTNLELHSFIFASYAVIRQSFPHTHEGIIMDIGGDVTEIAIMRDDILLHIASLPFGYHHIFRYMQRKLGGTLTEMASLLYASYTKQLSETRQYEVEPVIRDARNQWEKQLHHVMTDMAQSSLIPDTVFLHTRADMMTLFKEGIEQDNFAHYTLTHHSFTVATMDLSVFSGKVLDHDQKHDPFLITATLFAGLIVDRPHQEGENYFM